MTDYEIGRIKVIVIAGGMTFLWCLFMYTLIMSRVMDFLTKKWQKEQGYSIRGGGRVDTYFSYSQGEMQIEHIGSTSWGFSDNIDVIDMATWDKPIKGKPLTCEEFTLAVSRIYHHNLFWPFSHFWLAMPVPDNIAVTSQLDKKWREKAGWLKQKFKKTNLSRIYEDVQRYSESNKKAKQL